MATNTPNIGHAADNLFSLATGNVPVGAQRVLGNVASSIHKVLSAKEFIKGLNQIAPPLICDGHQAPKRLRDAEFDCVADWCKMYGKEQWSLRPRTFIVLHMIGCREAVDDFIQQGYSDIALPYTAANLPKAVKGDKARRHFLDLQNYVLTAHAEHLEKEGESHQNVEGSADDYFVTVRELGRGSFGQVDHVVGRLSIDHFARKRIPRGRSFRRDQEAIRTFENELKTLKTLSHRHLVKLISSYTDRNWVGLIMKPVANYNFERFLSDEDIDQVDRQTCLRRFFGCLATAVNFLHQKQIRHKDIKPANILVRERAVLLTDFGTSHNWSDDTRSTSSGTSVGFTKRYCAPEVAGHASRNQSADVWSLGCVFFEMGTVLNNRLVDEMRSYFETHGSRGPYVRGNKEAADMWLEELKQACKCVDDMQPLYLSRDMCQEDQNQRPTAAQVVSEVLDFQGEVPYCGHCCDSENGTVKVGNVDLTEQSQFPKENESNSSTAPLYNMKPPNYAGDTSHPPLESSNDERPKIEDLSPNIDQASSLARQSNWQQPTVEDYEGTVRMTDRPGSPAVAGNPEGALSGEYREIMRQHTQTLAESDESKPRKEDIPKCHNALELSCQWPGCAKASDLKATFNGLEELQRHYRRYHLVHEFGRSQLLISRPSTKSLTRDQFHADRKTCTDFILTKATPLPEGGHATPTRIKPPVKTNINVPHSESQREHRNSTMKEEMEQHLRFSMLAGDRRPKPTISIQDSEEDDPNYDFIASEPLKEPMTTADITDNVVSNNTSFNKGSRVPKSSMVPSYFLASTNRFTRREIEMMVPPTRISTLVPPPLFVYGSLMFPSIVRATAERFTGTEGTYSERYQRRLKTDTSDWSRINLSIQHAAEHMTPAKLYGYERFKPRGLRNANICPDKTGGAVMGFVLFGLSEEALKCYDHLFSRKELEVLYGNSDFQRLRSRTEFRRFSVKADITLQGGDTMTINAITYDLNLTHPAANESWDINKFVRSKTFTRLSGAWQDTFVAQEEARLAYTMGMTLVLLGDALCGAIVRKDTDRLLDLLDEGHDVNAPCTRYGSLLAAAAFHGQEDYIDILIRRGANPNAVGGEYHTPLIAATTQGYETCVWILLKAGADVLAQGGRYISAIYQAVDFGDVDLTKLLLERGAWLTGGYQELLDLSTERGSRGITRLLEDYDVRKLYLLPRMESDSTKDSDLYSVSPNETGARPQNEIIRRHSQRALGKHDRAPSALTVIKAVGLQALYLKGRPGKWTGIKAVKVLQVAFEVGVSESILDNIRPNMRSYQTLVDYLGRAVTEYEQGQISSRSAHSPRAQGKLPSTSHRGRDSRQSPGTTTPFLPHSQPNTATAANMTNNDDDDDDAFCLACDGRGGRRGTGRTCTDCRGVGRIDRPPHSRLWSAQKKKMKCRTCNGSGLIFAERDRCRACNNGAGSSSSLTRSRSWSGQGTDDDVDVDRVTILPNEPPPPYTSIVSLAKDRYNR